MPTALTAYTTVTNATFGSARQLASSASGTAAAVATTIARRTGWHFLFARGGTAQSQGATGSPLAAIPADVFGFLWEVSTLEGQRLAAGSVTPAVRIQASSVLISGKVAVRYWKRSGAGVFTAIGATQEASGSAFTTTALTRTLPAVTLTQTDFDTGDQLYVEVLVDVTGNSANSNSATISVVEAGTTSPTAFPTAGYDPVPAPVDLSLQDGTHGHTASAPSLTQGHSLTVASASHTHLADAPTLTQQHTLNLADGAHAHTASSPTLTVATTLSPANVVHGHVADSPSLTVDVTLTVDPAVHGHTASVVTLTTVDGLAVADVVHGHVASAPTIEQTHLLTVAPGTHQHTASEPTVTQTHLLAVVDTTHPHTAETARLGGVPLVVTPTPSDRVYIVRAEMRDLTVTAEHRSLHVPAEDRRLRVAAEPRPVQIPTENRTVEV